MHTKAFARSFMGFLLLSIALSACSAQAANAFGRKELASPTSSQYNDVNRQVMRTYHTVLMVERAADLMIEVIEKEQAGEFAPGDVESAQPYLEAFEAALDDYNQTTPPPGVLNHPWQTASRATVQFGSVYSALIQGKMISANDLVNLGFMRQLLTNYQSAAEGFLTSWGLGVPAYFASQHLAVEKHLQMFYGDQPVPSPVN